MRFLRAEIYGFGKWVDVIFDFSNSSLTSLYGKNESGKSTLQQFILYMLFGLPPRKRDFYKPKNSNRVGGMLTIEDEKIGIYTIERVEDELNCLLPCGNKRDERWLEDQLKGLTREVYRAIYSFSAVDLSNIRSMKADELSDVLFSVGLTGATNIYHVERLLDNKLGELFKKTGRKPKINQQINIVNETYSNLLRYKEKESKYRDKKAWREKLVEEISETQRELRNLQEELLNHEKIQHIIPLINDYRQLTDRLAALPEEIPFPEDGVARFQSLKTNLLLLQSETATLHKNNAQYNEKISKMENQLYSEQTYEFAESIVKDKQAYETCLREINELEKKLESTTQLLNEQLQHIALDKSELEEIVLPFHLETSWKEISDMNVELRRDNNKLADDLQVINQEMNRLRNEKSTTENKMITEEQINHLKTEINHYDLYDAELKNYGKQQEKWARWEKKRTKVASITFVTTSILSLCLFFIGLSIDQKSLFTVSVFFLIAGIVQFFYVKKSLKDLQNNTIQKPSRTIISQSERKEYELILKDQERLQTDLIMIENELKRLNFAHLQWEERKRLYVQREKNWLDRLETERFQYPFLDRIDPAHWVELLRIVQQIKQLIQEQKQFEEQLNILIQQKEKFHGNIATFAKNIDSNLNTIEEIENIIDTGRSKLQLIHQYNDLLEENIEKQNELKEKINVYLVEMNSLYNIAKVHDEEGFLKAAKDLEEKQQIMDEQLKIEQQISTMFSKDFKNQLLSEGINYNEIELAMNEMKEKIESNQLAVSSANKKLATVEIEIEQMEMSEANSKATFMYQVERDKLNELAQKWAVLKVAQTTLMHAKNAYQEKYLTEVMNLTSKYFKQLTNGIYERVFAPTATKQFQVEGNNYIRYTVDELSQGTVDQLYVSLRLAISKVMSNKFVIPLLIDDAFVHFDEQRTELVIHLIKQMSHDQQILFFTCKKDIAKKLHASHIVNDVRVSS